MSTPLHWMESKLLLDQNPASIW